MKAANEPSVRTTGDFEGTCGREPRGAAGWFRERPAQVALPVPTEGTGSHQRRRLPLPSQRRSDVLATHEPR